MENTDELRVFGLRHHGNNQESSMDYTKPTLGGMPLSMANPGKEITVSAIHGRDNTKRFLENLGFVEGAQVTVVSELGGNVIVNVKESRIAISKAMAARVLVS